MAQKVLIINSSGQPQQYAVTQADVSGLTTGSSPTFVTVSASLTGNVTGNCSGSSGSCTGNSATVTGLSVVSGKTLTASNTITFTATDGSTLAIGTGGTLAAGAYASASSSTPNMNGTGSAGSSGAWARGDHTHPTDTSCQAALTNPVTGTGTQYYLTYWTGTNAVGALAALGSANAPLLSAGPGAIPAWAVWTFAAPGATGAVLTSDGTNWTRNAAPSISAANMTSFPTLNQSTTGSSGSCTGNAATVSGLSVASGKTLTASNTITLAGTDGSTLNVGTGGTLGSMATQAASSVAITGGTMSGVTISGGSVGGIASGCVGDARNVAANQSTAGSSLAFTADQVIVVTALNGSSANLPSYSQTLNVSGTGAGGMDTGSAPTSGFVSIYAIYGTSGTSILAQNAATSATSVYTGSHMPSGYTYSALISTWPTNSSGQLAVGNQVGRQISIYVSTLWNALSGGLQNTWTSVSLSGIVPPNAKIVHGLLGYTGTGSYLANNNYQVGYVTAENGFTSFSLPIITSQTIYYSSQASAGTYVCINGYTI